MRLSHTSPGYDTVTHSSFNSLNDGAIEIVESQNAGTINNGKVHYLGLDTSTNPIDDFVSAANRVFVFSGGAETIAISDNGIAPDSINSITSTLGGSVHFLNPATGGSLTIETSMGGGSGADQINVQGLDSKFSADLTIVADSDDTLHFQTNDLQLDDGDLTVDAGQVSIQSSVTTTGEIDLTATDSISRTAGTLTADTIAINAGTGIGSTGAIQTAADTVTFSNTISGDVQFTDADAVTFSGTNASDGSLIDLQTTNGTLTTNNVNQTNGNISLTANGADNQVSVNATQTVNSGNGDIIVTADRVNLAGDLTTAAGNIIIAPFTAGESIGIGGGSGDLNLDDGEISRLSTLGSITIGDTATGTGVVDVDSSTFSNNITVVGGSISVTGLSAGSNTVVLHARTGNIADGGDAADDINALALELNAATGIGATDAIDTVVANLAFSNDDGIAGTGTDVNISNTGTLIIADLTGVGGTLSSSQSDGGGTISAAGQLSINTAMSLGADFTLETTDSGTDVDHLTINSNVTHIGSTGAAKAINLRADDDVRFDAGSVTFANVNAGDLISVTSTSGGVTDGSPGESAVMIAPNVALRAANGIGAGAAGDTDDIDLEASTVAFQNTASGIVNLQNSGALTIGNVDGLTSSMAVGGGSVTASSPLTIAHAVTVGASMSFIAGDDNATDNDDLTIAAAVLLNATTNSTLTFQAGDDVIIQSGGSVTTSDSVNDAAAHTISITADNEGAGGTDTDRGSVTQQGAGTTISRTTGTVTLNVDSADGVGDSAGDTGTTADNALRVSVDNLEVMNSLDNDVLITEADSVDVNRIVQSGADDNVDLAAAGTITLAAGQFGVSAVGGTLTLSASGTASDVELESSISTDGGNVIINAGDDVTSTLAGTVIDTRRTRTPFAPGSVTVTSANGTIGDRSASQPDGIDIAGTIDASATPLSGGGAPGGNVTLTATSSGSVVQVGSVIATGDRSAVIPLPAGTGGTVDIDAADTVTVGTILANGGPSNASNGGIVTVDAGGDIDLSDVNVSGNSAFTVFTASLDGGDGGSVTVSSTAGSVAVTNILANAGNGDDATDGGDGGAISLTSGGTGDVTIRGTISSVAGVGGGSGGTNGTDGTVLITSAGAIVDASAGENANIIAGAAALRAASGIGHADDIDIDVSDLAFANTTANNVQITDLAGGLTINSVDGLLTSSNTSGDVTLVAASPVTFAVDMTAAGDIHVQALESATMNFDNIVVNSSVTVESTGGDVKFEAGDRIVINDMAVVTASGAGGDVTLDSGFGDTDNDGSMTLDGTVAANATDGIVRLDLNAQGAATQSADGSITGNGLQLVSTTIDGDFDLDAGTTNDVATIAATTDGATIEYRDADTLEIGTVNGVNGVDTASAAVTLCVMTGNLNLQQQVTAGAGTVRLQTSESSSSITQDENNSAITAAALGGRSGSGGISLDSTTNSVTTFAASTTGSLIFAEADGFSVSSVGANACFTATTGITTTGSDVQLTTGGSITDTGSGNLQIGGTTTLAATGDIILDNAANDFTGLVTVNSAVNVVLQDDNDIDFASVLTVGGGDFTVDADSIEFTETATVAGNADLDAGIGDITDTGSGNLQITGTTTLDAATDITLDNMANDFGGSVTITSAVNATIVDANSVDIDGATITGDLDLTAKAGGITDTAALDVDGTTTLEASADIALDNTSNDFTRLVTVTSAVNVVLQDDNDIDFASVTTVSGGNLTVDADSIEFTQTATIAGNADLAAAAADITYTGSGNLQIAGTTTLEAATDIILDNMANDFGGSVNITSAANAKVADINAIAISGAAVTDNILLIAGGNLSQSGEITATELALMVDGVTQLDDAANNVTRFAANNGGRTVYRDADALDIGTVTVNGMPVKGVTTINADVLLQAGGAVLIGDVIDAGTADVRLIGHGNITQGIFGIITANELGVRQEGAIGNVHLCFDNAVDTVAINDLGGGTIEFQSTRDLTVGSVAEKTAGSAAFSLTEGVASTNGDIFIVTDGTLSIEQVINAGTADVRLVSLGDLTQTADGIITANELGVRNENGMAAGGDIDLSFANAVDEVAINNSAIGGTAAFRSSRDLTVGEVTSFTDSCGNIFGHTSGVSTDAGDILLASDQRLLLDFQVNSTLSADVRLVSNGNLSQDAQGIVVADELGIRQEGMTGNVTLSFANIVHEFAASNADDGGTVSFRSTRGLMIGAVTTESQTAAGTTFTATTGVVTSDGDILLAANDGFDVSTETLTVNEAIDAGTADVRLIGNGNITQSGTGLITANELSVRNEESAVAGNIALGEANNVDEFSAVNTGANGTVAFRSTRNLAVGAATAITSNSISFDAVAGSTTASGDALIQSDGSLFLDEAISVAAGTVRLIGHGDIHQDAEGIITAADVGVRQQNATFTMPGDLDANGEFDVHLCEDNVVGGNVAVRNAEAGGSILFNSTSGFSIGTVGDQMSGSVSFVSTSGLTTTNGDLLISSDAAISLMSAVNAGTGTLRVAGNGQITQSAAGTITAAELAVRQLDAMTGDIQLGEANSVDEFAADNDAAGGTVLFRSTRDLTIGNVAEFTDPCNNTFAATMGVIANGGDVKIVGDMGLEIAHAVNPGSGDLFLDIAGNVSQQASGTITAAGLALMVDGTTTLGLDNDVQTLATDTGGTVFYNDLSGLTIGTVMETASVLMMAIDGITSAADVKLSTGANLIIGDAVGIAGQDDITISGGHDLTLNVIGTVSQLADNVITASGLQLLGTGAVNLDDAGNDVVTLAADHSGTISYRDINALVVGTVTDTAMAINTTTDGIANDADVKLTTGGDLVIGDAVGMPGRDDITITDGNDLTLNVTGTVTQLADSVITAAGLQLLGSGAVNLDDAGNDIATLAADYSGTISYRDATGFAVGTVSDSTMTVSTVTSGISNDADVKLTSSGNVSFDDDINITTADLTLDVNGAVTQNAGDTISASGLQLLGKGAVNLEDPANEISVLSANHSGTISYQDATGIVIGSVTNSSMTVVVTTAGITNDADVKLVVGDATGENLVINEAIEITAADLFLDVAGSVSQTSPGTIRAAGLALMVDQTTTLELGNDVDVLAASVGDDVAYTDVDGFEIGTVREAASGATMEITGLSAAGSDVRLLSGGGVTQTSDGGIVASTLAIRQTGISGDVSLGNASAGAVVNDVDVLAVKNHADGGAITFFDANELRIGEIPAAVTGSTLYPTTTGLDSNAGDINITAIGTLTIAENIEAADDMPATGSPNRDETITLISRTGDIELTGGTSADPIVISTDEDPTPGSFVDLTGDRIDIIAAADGGSGVVTLGDPDAVEVRTDGGVARQIAPRPSAFAALPTTGAETAFVTLSDAENMRSNLTDSNGNFLGILELVFGVAGEENLEVVFDWGTVQQTDFSGVAGDAKVNSMGELEFSLADADKAIFHLDEGGRTYLIPHEYNLLDLIISPNDRNGREINPNIFGVRFSVAQHESISIWGNAATIPGAGGATEMPDAFTASDVERSVVDATGSMIDLPTAGLALLSSTDTNPLDEFHQEAAEAPFTANRNVTPTGRPEGLAEWEFVAGPSPGIVPIELTERPTLEIPKIEAPFDPVPVSEITGDIDFGAGAASESVVGTEVYLQIRRHFELDADAEIVIARITDHSFIANRDNFDEFVLEHPELQDGAGYEVWLITDTSGQRVERPIVEFEITGGRPGPATEQLPETFEPYELKDLEFEQPPAPEPEQQPMPPLDGEPVSAVSPVPPPEIPQDASTPTTVSGASPESVELSAEPSGESTFIESAAPVVAACSFTRASRWVRRQQDLGTNQMSHVARTVRKMMNTQTE